MVLANSQTGYCSSPSGRCRQGISRMVFFLCLFLFYILCLSPLLNCCLFFFFWQSMSNIINNIVRVMPKLLLWLGVSSFGGSSVYLYLANLTAKMTTVCHYSPTELLTFSEKVWRASLKRSYVRNCDMPRESYEIPAKLEFNFMNCIFWLPGF